MNYGLLGDDSFLKDTNIEPAVRTYWVLTMHLNVLHTWFNSPTFLGVLMFPFHRQENTTELCKAYKVLWAVYKAKRWLFFSPLLTVVRRATGSPIFSCLEMAGVGWGSQS